VEREKQGLNYTVYCFNALACLMYNFSSDNIYLVAHVFRGFFLGVGGCWTKKCGTKKLTHVYSCNPKITVLRDKSQLILWGGRLFNNYLLFRWTGDLFCYGTRTSISHHKNLPFLISFFAHSVQFIFSPLPYLRSILVGTFKSYSFSNSLNKIARISYLHIALPANINPHTIV